MPVGLLMVAGGVGAGAFGSLLGLGGGTLIVPLLTLGFGLDLREAVGVSLVSVIMTSSAAAGVYLERHVANMRLGMTLELFTAIGALVGGSVAFLLDERLLSFLFAGLLGYVAFTMARPRPGTSADEGTTEPGPVEPEPAPAGDHADARSIACPARGTASATSAVASSARPSRASSRRCSASAAGSSRSR